MKNYNKKFDIPEIEIILFPGDILTISEDYPVGYDPDEETPGFDPFA